MNKTVKQVLVIGFILLALFITWFVWDGFIRDKTPQFFPFNELQGDYSIIKSLDSGIFMVKYKGPNSFTGFNQDDDGSISVIIGRTNYDLNQYLGKKVLLTKGNFEGGFTKQCVAGNCVGIGGPYAAVVINEMEEVQEAKPRDRVVEYVVDKGDTLEAIAEKFDISSDTIISANNLNTESVNLGQKLKILPVTGVIHTVFKGETIYSIAQKYQVDVEKIIDFPYNTFVDNKYALTPGQTLMVPDGIKK